MAGHSASRHSLKTVFPGLVTMKVNTALGLIFSAASLWLLLPGVSRVSVHKNSHRSLPGAFCDPDRCSRID